MTQAWDLPTRLFHWLLVVIVVSAWVSYEFAEDLGDVTLLWHRWNGLAGLTLIVWRLLWGVAGSSTSLFSNFLRGPGAALAYARALLSGTHLRYLGHNPLGAWMVIAFLAVLGLQASLGLFAVDDNDLTGGPLHRLVSEASNDAATSWHARIFNYAVLPLVAVHVAANLLYAFVLREPLIVAMVTGHKPSLPYVDAGAAEIPGRPLLHAALCLLAAAALVAGTILALGGRIPG